ncbi:MAG TPA: chemotaxis protein CheW [Pirellulales bacterium]|jgi:purine-binding chemotaxis protein CheW|nr:chemotaxis protein CheW [Pirellulales bacterium]
MADTRLYCTLYLESYYFGVEVSQVQEVLRYLEMTRIPLAHSVVRGLINLRGQLVTAIDLRRRLELPPREENANPMNVIVRTEDGPVSLLVDRIGDVVEVQEADFERPPETLRGAARSLVLGVYKLAGKLLLILDLDRAVQLPGEREELALASA